MLIAFNKPCGVLSQFTPDGKNRTLAEFNFPKDVYPIGRLDSDSEGLLLLSDQARWNTRILNPKEAIWKTYYAQVERVPNSDTILPLRTGVIIEGKKTLPARVEILDPQPDILPRNPPIRYRKNVPDCWIALQICEGRNRQVRKMTAAVGHPTLRLIRIAIGELKLDTLLQGEWKTVSESEATAIFSRSATP
ncbi:MAG: pseudouridine synthase [Chthoniobacterales bacterium]